MLKQILVAAGATVLVLGGAAPASAALIRCDLASCIAIACPDGGVDPCDDGCIGGTAYGISAEHCW